jgi:hypothetical protein
VLLQFKKGLIMSKRNKNGVRSTIMKKPIFFDFHDFWSCTKRLEAQQRNRIFSSLSSKEQKRIEESYQQGGWEDCFMRNRIDNILDGIKKDFSIDMLYIKTKAIIEKKCTYIKQSEWQWISDVLSRYPEKHTMYVLGGIKAEDEGNNIICISKK